MNCFGFLWRSLNQGNTLEEINISLMNMPEDYSLGHCVAKDMRMSAGIAMYFKLVNNIVLLKTIVLCF